MLSVPYMNEFGWTVDNFGATYSDTGIGTSVTSGAINTKGTAVSLIAGASVTQDALGIAVGFSGGFLATNVRQFLADLLIDPAGGTSWSTLIPNLVVNSPCLHNGGYWYFFPLYIKNGTSIGMQHQCSTASIAMRGLVKLFGKPSRPEMWKVGSKVETFGANTGTSGGTAITPGTSAMGAYTASLGTTANHLWWWQGGLAINDTTQTNVAYLLDVAAGDATNKKICAENIPLVNAGTAEQTGKSAIGTRGPYRHIKAGELVYMRAACSGTPDSSITAVAYGVGG